MDKNSYHNTTHQDGQRLLEFEQVARNQEALVLHFYRKNEGTWFTAEDVMDMVAWTGPVPPRTSAGRAITNLCAQGKLIKSSTAIGTSKYARPCYAWCYPEHEEAANEN